MSPTVAAVARTLVFVAALVASGAVVAQQWPEAHPPVGRQPRRPANYEPFRYPHSAADLLRDETPELRQRARVAMGAVRATIAAGPYSADHASIARHSCPEWFLDAKFGMFVDWGPWSVAGWAPQAEKATYPDWYEQRLFKEFREYHVETWGADIGPDDLIQLLRGESLRPAGIVELARVAGMRYVVPFLKHHGGYALWDSSYTHRDTVEWGLRRDIAREFADAARSAGLRFGAYVSLGEWGYPIVKEGELWTIGLDGVVKERLTAATPFVSGKVPVPDFTGDYLVPSLAELVDRVSPDMLWFDGEWESGPQTWQSPALAAYFYNRAAARHQEVAINDRLGKGTRGVAGWGDFYTSEYHVIEGFQAHPWEENRSLSHSYGYNWEESLDERYVLSDEQSLDLLLRVVANGGNLLLMVSPDGSGRIPPNQERRLRVIGTWLARHGQAVYATRPVGVLAQPEWGYLTRSKAGDRLYCIVRRWPPDGRLVVPVKSAARHARTLGSERDVPISALDGHPVLDLSRVAPTDLHASVFVLDIAPADASRQPGGV
jgi:alpha-L-fucosidase